VRSRKTSRRAAFPGCRDQPRQPTGRLALGLGAWVLAPSTSVNRLCIFFDAADLPAQRQSRHTLLPKQHPQPRGCATDATRPAPRGAVDPRCLGAEGRRAVRGDVAGVDNDRRDVGFRARLAAHSAGSGIKNLPAEAQVQEAVGSAFTLAKATAKAKTLHSLAHPFEGGLCAGPDGVSAKTPGQR